MADYINDFLDRANSGQLMADVRSQSATETLVANSPSRDLVGALCSVFLLIGLPLILHYWKKVPKQSKVASVSFWFIALRAAVDYGAAFYYDSAFQFILGTAGATVCVSALLPKQKNKFMPAAFSYLLLRGLTSLGLLVEVGGVGFLLDMKLAALPNLFFSVIAPLGLGVMLFQHWRQEGQKAAP